MQVSIDTLKGVAITGGPLRIKKDTIEYSADYYKTRPNAILEDLLKKLPGVQINNKGVITVDGEGVQQLLVNGKKFFGGDPLMATQNLPAEIIDKIQVYKALSDRSRFSGFDDGKRKNTINVVIKKNRRVGLFGKASTGIGTENKYNDNLSINRFNSSQQISMVAQADNTNGQNFESTSNPTGAGSISASTISLNYSDDWKKDATPNGNAFYGYHKTNIDAQNIIQTILPNNLSTNNYQRQVSKTDERNGHLNLGLEKKFDSLNSLNLHLTSSFRNSTQNSVSTTAFTYLAGNDSIYNSSNTTVGNESSSAILGTLLFMHRFKKQFRTFSLNINATTNTNNINNNNLSFNKNYSTALTDTINQRFKQSINNSSADVSLSYTEPIDKNQIIDIEYKYNFNKNNSTNVVNLFNKNTGKFDLLDSAQTNQYNFLDNSQNLNLLYKLQKTKYNLTVGSAIQTDNLKMDDITNNNLSNKNYISILPSSNFIYNVSQSKNITLDYHGQSQLPSIQQLQPTNTTNDSLIIYKGNPILKQSYSNSVSLSFTTYNTKKLHSLSTSINVSITTNNILNSLTQLPNGVQINLPINLNGSFSLNGSANYNFPLQKINSQIALASNLSYSQTPNLVNDIISYSKYSVFSQNVNFSTNALKNVDLSIGLKSSYNIIKSSLVNYGNNNYFTQNILLEAGYYTGNNWSLKTKLNYTYNSASPISGKKGIPLISANISKQLLKNKRLNSSLEVFDLLNQNTNVLRVASGNTIQDSRSNALKRYFMLKVAYNISYFNKKKKAVQQK